jgi:hypothetical protein
VNLQSTERIFLLLICSLLALSEPALANKFETISGGVAGSYRVKSQFVESGLLFGGIGFLIASVLAVVMPHTNAAYLNYANWKSSAIVLAVIGASLLIGYALY